MAEVEISIKGIRSGVLVTLPEGRWTKQHDILIKQLQTQERFFKGGRIALDVGDTEWNLDALRSLMRTVGDEGVCLWAILSTNPVTVQAAEAVELATKVKPDSDVEPASAPALQQHAAAPVLQKPGTLWLSALPAGELLVEWEGDIVLLGDLPAGVEIRATGSVLVWGKVMGTVRFGTHEPNKNHLRLLTCDNPTIYFNMVLIDIPKKLRKGQAISVRMVDGQVIVESELRGGFKLI